MKKKIIILILSFLLMVSCAVIIAVSASRGDISASPEFEEAKKLAMTAQPDKDGDYFIRRDIGEVIYIVGYFPRLKYIGGCMVAGPRGPLFSVIYDESDGYYFAESSDIRTGRRIAYDELTRERASEIMSNILNHITNVGIAH